MSNSALSVRLASDDKALFERYCKRIGNPQSEVLRGLVRAFNDAGRRCIIEGAGLIIPFELRLAMRDETGKASVRKERMLN